MMSYDVILPFLVLINSHVVLAHISSFHLLAVCSVFSPEEGARVAVRKISHGRTSFEVGVGLAVVLSRKKKKKIRDIWYLWQYMANFRPRRAMLFEVGRRFQPKSCKWKLSISKTNPCKVCKSYHLSVLIVFHMYLLTWQAISPFSCPNSFKRYVFWNYKL